MNADQVENLVARICDQQAEEADWIEFAALARADAGLWRVLAETQRQQTALARAVEQAAGCADAVELPLESATFASPQPVVSTAVRHGPVVGRIRAWSGWAVAAVVMLLLAGQWVFRSGEEQSPAPLPNGISTVSQARGDDAGLRMASPSASPADSVRSLVEASRDRGLLLGEIPERVLIDARPAADGQGYELLYLRQFLEQAIVPDLYVPAGQDEQGKPTLVRFENRPGKSM